MQRGQWQKIRSNLRWLPAYALQRLARKFESVRGHCHLIIAIADHFEPSMTHDGRYADLKEQKRRLNDWCRDYPEVAGAWLDADGYPLRHTYFYPAEQYNPHLIDVLVEHCRKGWGEIEIHLHHGFKEPDTAENTTRVLVDFRDTLAAKGCLSRFDGSGEPRYAFVHGNWALANSAGGRCCGVDQEMRILAETGCYADFTLPSAPHQAQVAKINSLYECSLPLEERAPHRRGRDLAVGRAPQVFPLIVQGPLLLDFSCISAGKLLPRIENAELTAKNPPTMGRLGLWKQAAVAIAGRPDWLFIKLHCHGLDPREQAAMSGPPFSNFLRDLVESASASEHKLHFVSAREMTNMILAACDGHDEDPARYRDYRLKRIQAPKAAAVSVPQTKQEPDNRRISCVS